MLCWLQQALRASDNPVIDAAILLGKSPGLPVVFYHRVREDHPFASARFHSFILGVSPDLERDCATDAWHSLNWSTDRRNASAG